MAISFEFDGDPELQARIKVVGVGGGGGNALNTMISSDLEGVEFIAANTDAQALPNNLAPHKIHLGPQLTKGLGAGGNPEVGRKAALEDITRIQEALAGADMVFVTAGMGGGTGTGAAPVVAQVARDMGALTVAVVTKPFTFEGRRRAKNAELGIQELGNAVDTIITIPNQKLLTIAGEDMSMLDAFQRADDVLLQAVRGISDLIVHPGLINVDFADVKTIMCNMGRALMGTGYGKGKDRAIEAARMAIASPLLDEVSVEGATGILLNFTAGPDVKLSEIEAAASLVQESAHEDANIIFGVVTDSSMGDMVKVTVIATGFENVAESHVETRLSRSSYPMPSRASSAGPVRNALSSRPPEGRVSYSNAPGALKPRPSQVPQEAVVAATRPSQFGASAIHDERVLDIPAYLRRGNNQSHE
ncbi:MAG TPA: cell division protein FtsZ [Polyangiales bacterium]|nr:cell division protein FtsZ [Polyangiales bacterium]